MRRYLAIAVITLATIAPQAQVEPFRLQEATIENIHSAYKAGRLTSRQLVQLYLNRIGTYDKKGPAINSILTLNPNTLQDADRLDAAFKVSGLTGPLHGIPVLIKDQLDTKGMPTTLGSVLLKDYYPDKDSFVADKLRKAGAIILGKTTLGELGGGDTHGSLFGSTRNPYDLSRTAGGSSGGSAASIAANFVTVAVGEEGLASIRRPATWNSIVGMRPTAGLVSRTGMFDGWPGVAGSLGPMARTVTDLARLLDVMVGYDAEDPLTARGVGHSPDTYTKFLDKNGLKGARIGVLRESMGLESEPMSQDVATCRLLPAAPRPRARRRICAFKTELMRLSKADFIAFSQRLKTYPLREASQAPFRTEYLYSRAMDTSDITRLHGLCVEGLRAYIQKAKNTCALLESMTSFPPSRETWLKALEQRLTENEAHGRYQTAREQSVRGAPANDGVTAIYSSTGC